MNNILFVAPHPDDETLGCGGTILKLKKEGLKVNWLVITSIENSSDFSTQQINDRKNQIKKVSEYYGFDTVKLLGHNTAELDCLPKKDLVNDLSVNIEEIKPDTIFLPFPGDVHSDHKIAFEALEACTKTFRKPYIKKILAYETISETGYSIDPKVQSFRPNFWIDISKFLDKKVKIMKLYQSEIAPHPFPRSEEAIRALALLRGSESNCTYAESFQLMKYLT